MILAATGHRPGKLGGYDPEIGRRLVAFAREQLEFWEPKQVLSGMAQGWDQAIAIAATRLGISWDAVVPFAAQCSRWSRESQTRYRRLLRQAASVVIVSTEDYSPEVMQRRNEYLVDRCSLLLALWDGSKGGTRNCIEYAKQRRIPVVNCWQSWQTFTEAL